jgi:predicted MFS family arabinose efflux permease
MRDTTARVPHPGLVHSALAVGGFAIGTTEFATMSLLPFFARDLGIDAPTAGHVISAYALGVVVGAPLIAVISARMARRTLLIVLMSLFALANGLSALAPSYHWMLLFRFLSGLPHGAYFGIAALTAVPAASVPFALAAFGIGLTAGNLIAPRFADRALMPTAGGLLVWSAIALALYPLAAGHLWSILLDVTAVGIGGALGTVMQTRLMDVAGDAQALAAALNHAAFNTANALGPWLGGLAIAAGYGWTSTGWVGCGLALAGLAIWAVSVRADGIQRTAGACV